MRAALWLYSGDTDSYSLFAGPTEGTAVTNLTTAAAQSSTVTFSSVSALSISQPWQAIYMDFGWKITGAGGANGRDVLTRKGTASTLVSPAFTDAGPSPTLDQVVLPPEALPRRRG
jgi:hypothetical protein